MLRGDMDSDWQWIQEFQAGDESAFRKIFEKYTAPLINLAHRFTRSQPAAEDVVQEVFIKIYEKKVRPDTRAKFSTWLYRVTVNASIDYFRRSKWTRAAVDEQLADPHPQNPRQTLSENEVKVGVQAAVAGLPEKFRYPISLYQFEDLSYREIARILEITEKAVERRIYKAKEILREKLGGIFRDEPLNQ